MPTFKVFISFIFFLFIFNNISFAESKFSNDSNNSFLKADEAFVVLLRENSANEKQTKTHIISFNIAKGYYLYKDKIEVFLNDKQIDDINFPKSKIKFDEFFGESEIYEENFILKIFSDGTIDSLSVIYQGCANKGLCYPPIKKTLFPYNDSSKNFSPTKVSEQEIIYGKLISNNIFTNILLFVGLGLLLSFTPCVLPMIPILSGIILKSSSNSRRPFLLSLNYVLGVCSIYLLVGIFIGYSSDFYNIQSIFQDPIYLVIFSTILVFLALSMFGLYDIKVPSSFQNWINSLGKNINGRLGSSYIMGSVSALIVGPCVAPPLAGIFIYITSENPGPVVTGILFLSLSIGMSIPLLAYGTFMGKFIPKTGKWMLYINYFIGGLLLIVALLFIDRITPIFSFNSDRSQITFYEAKNVEDLKSQLSLSNGKIKLVDVYADWCVECKLMEQKTFKDESVEKILKKYQLIKIDVTNNTKSDKELLRYLNIIGPPAYKFYNKEGKKIQGFTIQGYMNSKDFNSHLMELNNY